MARQKMHVALLRNQTSAGKLSEKSSSSSTKSLEEDKHWNLIHETSFIVFESAAECAYVTYMSFGPDRQWTRILSLPAECFDNIRGLVDMDGLCVVSPAPIIPFSVNHPKYLRSILHIYSANPLAEAKLSGIVIKQYSQKKAFSDKCVNPVVSPPTCAVWSDSTPDITETASVLENYEVPRRKSKKKAKKKRKQSKKLDSDAVLVGSEALSVSLSNGISTVEPFDDHAMELDGSDLSTADLADPLYGTYDTKAVRGDGSSGVSPPCLMDTCLRSSRSGSQAFETEELVHIRAAKDTLCQQINWFNCDSEATFGNLDSIVSDHGFTCLNKIDSGDTICDVTNNSCFISPEASVFAGNSVSSESSSILSVEFGTQTKGRKICSKEGSNSEMQVYTRRGNCLNSIPGRYSNKRTAHGHFGKENLHSVWKKVHKTDSSGVYSMEKSNNMNSRFSVTSQEKPRHEGYCNFTTKLSVADDSYNFQAQNLRKPRNKIAPEPQQKGNFQSRKEYHLKKDRQSMLLKVNQEYRRSFSDAAQKKIKQARGSSSRYLTPSNGSSVELHTNKVDCTTRTSDPGMKVHPHEPLLPDICPATNDQRGDQNSEVRYRHPTESNGFVELSNCLDQTLLSHLAVKDDDIHMEREASFASNGKKDYTSGFVLQRWIPVGRKVPCPTGLERSDTSLLLHFDKPDAEFGCSKSTTKLSCDSIPSFTSEVEDPSPIFEKLHASNEGITEINELTSATPVKPDSNRKFANLVGVDDIQVSTNDVFRQKTTLAVDDGYRVKVESEARQTAFGSPIAGFEKFLHSACPVILEVEEAFKCQLCHAEPATISILCTHGLQSVCLRSLWEWYERHGSYGLEVREDRYHDPTKLRHSEFGLRAYFVPFLSAVQLFRKCQNGDVNGLKCLRPGGPCSHTDALRISLQVQSCGLHPCRESVDSTAHSEVSTGSHELIFEYFESEQPQRRQPLFDKIRELAEGEASPQQVYGDPAMLTSTDICDLHPRSWYSVAWYPIYKIPDGNFRAAFLTYHSLGHLVHRETSSNSTHAEIVFPIVGLLSCNAQREGWFHTMDCEAQKPANTTNLSLPETVQERLRTLEHTASLFSTSIVSKGNTTSVNSHHDYTFFSSRRR